jgi:molybdopterin converting factor small subunit
MPKINLIYFGSVKDATGLTAETVESPPALEALKSLLEQRYPLLTSLRYRFSVNRQLVNGDRQLAEGDEIALMPPFAGG